MKKLSIGVIIGSVRNERNGDAIKNWLHTELSQYKGDLSFDIIDLQHEHIPRFVAAKVPAQRAYDDDFTKQWSTKINAYDGFVVVVPEYNHGYPSVIKDALDHLFHEWVFKPIAFVSYGTQAGIRAVEQLRQVAIQLNMAPIRNQVSIHVWDYVKEGILTEPARFHDATHTMLGQLEWWAKTLKAGREAAEPVL